MARAGRKDRGLLSKPDSTGKPMWYVRLYHEGQERRFGSLQEQDGSARLLREGETGAEARAFFS